MPGLDKDDLVDGFTSKLVERMAKKVDTIYKFSIESDGFGSPMGRLLKK